MSAPSGNVSVKGSGFIISPDFLLYSYLSYRSVIFILLLISRWEAVEISAASANGFVPLAYFFSLDSALRSSIDQTD
ncbi:hypothetical protein [uncultured Amphritea sp.]|uniref:hypothetical protein n=1 Tax=Amphritea sp. TaxID=1872502 RepID=UPI0025DDAD0F|nr:hypothetical protein [uncultured Amphritea sp.]